MIDQKERQIRELALFRGCRRADVRWIAQHADAVDVPAGQRIAHEGQTVREFIVLVSGTAAAADGDGTVVLTPGAYLGERGLIDRGPHPRTVETLSPSRLLVFDARVFRGMLNRLPSLRCALLPAAATDLRAIDSNSVSSGDRSGIGSRGRSVA